MTQINFVHELPQYEPQLSRPSQDSVILQQLISKELPSIYEDKNKKCNYQKVPDHFPNRLCQIGHGKS